MNQTTVQQLQAQLSQFLQNSITLDVFRDWFDDETWGLAAEADSLARQLAGEVELRIAEFTSGHLNEDELRRQLESLLYVADFQLPVTYIEQPVEMIFS